MQTLFHVLRKDTGEELSLNLVADCMIVTHHVNAYEEDGHIVMDVIAYDDDNLFKLYSLDQIKKEPGDADYKSNVVGQIRRFVLPLSKKKVIKFNRNSTYAINLTRYRHGFRTACFISLILFA